MTANRFLTVAAIVLSMAGTSWAASPDQVGTWLGSAKISTFTAGNKSVSKQPIQIEIAADDSTTITANGVVQSMSILVYNTTDLFVMYGQSGATETAFISSFSFKNTTMKGSSVGINAAGGNLVSTIEAKYKLKKQ